jgi:hypothetical protein
VFSTVARPSRCIVIPSLIIIPHQPDNTRHACLL